MNTLDTALLVGGLSATIGASTLFTMTPINDAVYASHMGRLEQAQTDADFALRTASSYAAPQIEADLAKTTNQIYFQAGRDDATVANVSITLCGVSGLALLGSFLYVGKKLRTLKKENAKFTDHYVQSE